MKKGNFEYKVNICDKLQDNCEVDDDSLLGRSAVCQKSSDSDRWTSLGVTSDKLELLDGVVTLTYDHGKSCGHTNAPRVTTVTFVCPADGQADGLDFLSEDSDCGYHFEFRTALACGSTKVDCQITVNNTVFDFSPLSKDTVQRKI